jgi:hypothetical protein
MMCVAEFVGRLSLYAMSRRVAVVVLRAQRHPPASRGSHGRPGWGAREGAKKPGKEGGEQ